MRLSKVDFPDPLGPTKPAISPGLIVRSIFFTAWSPPNVFETSTHFSKQLFSSGTFEYKKSENIKLCRNISSNGQLTPTPTQLPQLPVLTFQLKAADGKIKKLFNFHIFVGWQHI